MSDTNGCKRKQFNVFVKTKSMFLDRIIERLDAKMIARTEQALHAAVPDCEREVAD